MNSLALAQIDNFNGVIAECGNKQSFAGRIVSEMIYSSFHCSQRDRLFQFERWPTLSSDGADAAATQRCSKECRLPDEGHARTLQRRTHLEQSAHEKGALDGICQLFGGASPPIVEKDDSRFFVRHVLVNGDNVDLVLQQ
jgi:hypothetical protein